MPGAQHDVGSRVEAARDVAHRDEPADVQAAHEAVGSPLGGVHRAHDAVEVDRDRERLGGGHRGRVAPTGDAHCGGHGGDHEQDEEQRTHGRKDRAVRRRFRGRAGGACPFESEVDSSGV